jgi:hypothetical protein
MSNFDNTNRGVLFKNDRKEGDKDRDYQGTATIEGKEYWVSVWVNKSKAGKNYMSLSFKAKEQKASAPKQSQPSHEDPFNDELPPF